MKINPLVSQLLTNLKIQHTIIGDGVIAVNRDSIMVYVETIIDFFKINNADSVRLKTDNIVSYDKALQFASFIAKERDFTPEDKYDFLLYLLNRRFLPSRFHYSGKTDNVLFLEQVS